jgi:hypothetical protein
MRERTACAIARSGPSQALEAIAGQRAAIVISLAARGQRRRWGAGRRRPGSRCG